MRTAEYEQTALQELRHILMDPGGQAENLKRRGVTHGGIRVEEVRLDTSGAEHEIVVLFRDLGRPERVFGYRIEALETPDVLHERSNPYPDLASAARGWAEVVWILFEEEVFCLRLRATPRLLLRSCHLDIGTISRACRC